MTSASSSPPLAHAVPPLVVAGPRFALGRPRGPFWPLRGITYGPFAPDAQGQPWPGDEQIARDLTHIAALGFNTLRLYAAPSPSLLAQSRALGLRLLLSVPWAQHTDFLSQPHLRRQAAAAVHDLATRFRDEPHVIGLLVANELEKSLVRWLGPRRVRAFLEELLGIARAAAPGQLHSYANYPSTEYLQPRNADYLAFNIYLEERPSFAAYLQHLQVLAEGRPLVITEFGLDTQRHNPAAQAQTFQWFQEECAQVGLAGACWFAYTDDWHNGVTSVTDWDFGLVTRDRKEKPACDIGRQLWVSPITTSAEISTPSPEAPPHVSILVCTRNGAATLTPCLESLAHQDGPSYEVLLIDDGSTDATPALAQAQAHVRYHRQDPAGLSAARNLGAQLARGAQLAYIDDDCEAPPGWLRHIAQGFVSEEIVAVGGPNLAPPELTPRQALFAAAPGAPSQVLLGDHEAEHLPGCNLAIRRAALLAVGGFRPVYTTAGDDVDICWRLRQAGGQLRFHPAAWLWHHRRGALLPYLRQQRGYGAAEALLIQHWPQHFAWWGGARWRGAIYGQAMHPSRGADGPLDRGPYGSALFPTLYTAHASPWLDALTGLPWLATQLLILGLCVFYPALLPISLGMAAASLARAAYLARRHQLHQPQLTTRAVPALTVLWWFQPIVRDAARFYGILQRPIWPRWRPERPRPPSPSQPRLPTFFWSREIHSFWSETGQEREAWLSAFTNVLRQTRLNPTRYRLEPHGAYDLALLHRGRPYALLTLTEYHPGGRTLLRIALANLGLRPLLWPLLACGLLAWLARLLTTHFHPDLEDLPATLLGPALALALFAAIFSVLYFRQLGDRQRLRALIDQAAQTLDLQPLAPTHASPRPHSPAPSSIPLATPPAPAEMCDP